MPRLRQSPYSYKPRLGVGFQRAFSLLLVGSKLRGKSLSRGRIEKVGRAGYVPNSSWFKEGFPRLERVNALQQGQSLADSSLPKATPFSLVGLPQYLS